ncbi:MAG: peptidoglycan-binding protein [Pseudomonadota bacterium]
MGRFLELDDTSRLDLNLLVKMLPGARGWNFVKLLPRGRYVRAILASWPVMQQHGINTPVRVAHFIGQGLVETGWLTATEENLRYSATQLKKTFSVYRDNPRLAEQHHRQPEKIANTAYGTGRLGERLGNTEPGDGWRFRGRGFFQVTGRDNYQRFGDIAGLPLTENPDILSRDLKTSVAVAAAYWDHMDLSWPADQGLARQVSRGVNRGDVKARSKAHSEDQRVLWTEKVLELLGQANQVIDGSGRALSLGMSGKDVFKLQEDLLFLGHEEVGAADGVFGRKTRLAVLSFQDEAGLEMTGVADSVTLEAIAEDIEEGSPEPEVIQATPSRLRFRPFEQGA